MQEGSAGSKTIRGWSDSGFFVSTRATTTSICSCRHSTAARASTPELNEARSGAGRYSIGTGCYRTSICPAHRSEIIPTCQQDLLNTHQDKPVPLIIQLVLVIFKAVAMPLTASVRVPVVAELANVIVSVVIWILIAPVAPFTNVTAAPTGNATLALAGMVIVLAATLVPYICLLASDKTSV